MSQCTVVVQQANAGTVVSVVDAPILVENKIQTAVVGGLAAPVTDISVQSVIIEPETGVSPKVEINQQSDPSVRLAAASTILVQIAPNGVVAAPTRGRKLGVTPTYDANGQLTALTYLDGSIRQFIWSAGRLTRVIYDSGVEMEVTYGPDGRWAGSFIVSP